MCGSGCSRRQCSAMSGCASTMPSWVSRLTRLRAVKLQAPICLASAVSLAGDLEIAVRMSRSRSSIGGRPVAASSRPWSVKSHLARASHFGPTGQSRVSQFAQAGAATRRARPGEPRQLRQRLTWMFGEGLEQRAIDLSPALERRLADGEWVLAASDEDQILRPRSCSLPSLADTMWRGHWPHDKAQAMRPAATRLILPLT